MLVPFLFAVLAQFPSDTRAFVESDHELIQRVCAGASVANGKVPCGKRCPASSGLDAGQHFFDWELVRVTPGHYLSPASDDAVIATEGCESHSSNWGGSLLATRRSGKWQLIWYEPGVETAQCHKVPIKSGREILVCAGEFGGRGNKYKQLYIEDLLRPAPSLMAGESHILELFDNTVTCGYSTPKSNTINRAVIEKAEFGGNRMSVIFGLGERVLTETEIELCEDGPDRPNAAYLPKLTQHRMDFVFDGRTFVPTAESAALAKRLGLH